MKNKFGRLTTLSKSGGLMSKKKIPPTDGFGPKEVKAARIALRLVWSRCHARKLVIKRCTDRDGWTYCEKCHKRTPKLKVDHLKACGKLTGGYLQRLFTPSKNLQGLCDSCHKIKTKIERSQAKSKKAVYTKDFF